MENDTLYLVRTDQIGRPVFATDSAGVKVWEASYLPFGGVETFTDPNPELRFPGQWFQAESGLHQNWMREYDPTLGRYLQADPLGLVDGASVYGYALQNPGKYVDPRGEFGTIGAALGATVSAVLQWSVNRVVGGMNAVDAAKCIDLVAVTNAAALGLAGFTPISLVRSGFSKVGAVGVAGASSQVNRAFPDLNIGELLGEECDCDANIPEWAKTLRDTIL